MKIESGHFYEETQCRHYDSAIIFKQSQSQKWGQKLLLNQHVNVFAFTAGKFENALPQAQFPLSQQICEKCVNIALVQSIVLVGTFYKCCMWDNISVQNFCKQSAKNASSSLMLRRSDTFYFSKLLRTKISSTLQNISMYYVLN